MNEGSAEQLWVGERVARAPSRTVPLNPAKLQQLSPRWAEDAVVSGRLIPEGQGLFPRAPLCCSPPKSSFRGGCLLQKGSSRQIMSSFSLWDLLSRLMRREGTRQPLFTPEGSVSRSAMNQWPSQLLIKARFSRLSQGGHTRRQKVRADVFTPLTRSCLLTVR